MGEPDERIAAVQLTHGSCDGVPEKARSVTHYARHRWTQQRNPFALGSSHGYSRDSREEGGRVWFGFRSGCCLVARWMAWSVLDALKTQPCVASSVPHPPP